MLLYGFKPSILEVQTGGSHEIEASLVYNVSSRKSRASLEILVLNGRGEENIILLESQIIFLEIPARDKELNIGDMSNVDRCFLQHLSM